ncbi:MAG TPA: hypothetical protein VMH20_08195 [Verrucomicrobiae bacterium]|nr:hypothetical protein [Verrucomicrobiae bacterium]
MDEHEFDALFPYRSFGSKEAAQEDARLRRCSILANALFGKTAEDLQQQLRAPYPRIPSGFSLNDFVDLQKRMRMMLTVAPGNPRFARSSLFRQLASRNISVGAQRYSMLGARYEIVRCAIDFLKNQN